MTEIFLKNDPIVQFCKIWADSAVSLLEQIGVASASATTSEPKAADGSTQEFLAAGVCARFAGGASLKGELVLCVDKATALVLAQTFMSEPLNPSAEFNGGSQDAYLEFAKQVAVHAATAWKQQIQQEVVISFHSATEPPFATAIECAFEIRGEALPAIQLKLLLNEEMRDALTAQNKARAQSPEKIADEPKQKQETPAGAAQGISRTENLDLLLDVELEATIRFGEREMLLKEIYGLMPGTVVELDQMINEPAKLLVAGRTVAWGEVVVVDGNFGLRVTEVASKNQRAEMLSL